MTSAFTASHRAGSGPPLVCLHGFADTWRTWDLVLPRLERCHDTLAPTLPGHAGGAPTSGPVDGDDLVDAVERAMDEAGFGTAHIVGNSLGGYLALRLAARGRAISVVALAPAGGWAPGDESYRDTLAHFTRMRINWVRPPPHAEALLATVAGRRRATRFLTTSFEHIPVELLSHLMRGVVGCGALTALIEAALREGWPLDAERITCPVRIAWGTADRLLPWPTSAERFRRSLLPNADWIELDGVGHCPQLDVPLESAELITGFTARPGGR